MRRAVPMLLPLLCCCSCAAPVLQLTALNPGSTWHHGVMETTTESDSLEWRVAFVGTEQGHLVFAVIAYNGSSTPRLVEPNAFSCVVSLSGKASKRFESAIPAVDPEHVLTDVSRQEASLNANRRLARSIDALSGMLDLTEDLLAKRTVEEQCALDHEREQRAEQREENRHADRERLADLAQMRMAWSDGAFRRTTLAPGEWEAGRVYFPAFAFAGIPSRGGSSGLESRLSDDTPRGDSWALLTLRISGEPHESVFHYSVERE